ncbi:MAG: tRNA (adenosine(37)-N6)-threonylcarbamoyltransferase complex transferase subunit TsaD [Elusimicrobia bacterium RIFCSPHIGHO2_02_FULL_57_9]|nr:MAG: tRNA (adenosine(37)-N6)-threonylcarbamoyltransferase complex transferase subunit TsaD [Elusimicrobia bacterium RIFCSPHIGHO2_02_FULL_57_9]
MRVLGIETSCDETAAAIVENGRSILSNVVSSQVALHRKYRGIVPELASRAHLQKIAGVVERAFGDCGNPQVDAVAYTQGPGLMGSLLVGKVAAQTLAHMLDCPLIGVNHLEGHIFAVELSQKLRFPLIALIVSGGHTDLILSFKPGRYRVLGRTRDDAAGEAFDKVARLLNLGYPGGPIIDRLAKKGDPAAVKFPRPLMPETWDFSFAGLKTAVLYRVQRLGNGPRPCEIHDLCASFQEAVVDTLAAKVMAAAQKFGVKDVVLGGGVAANSRLREVCAVRGFDRGIRVAMPPPSLCTDNGAMIAQAATHRLMDKSRPVRGFRCDPSLPFQNWAIG